MNPVLEAKDIELIVKDRELPILVRTNLKILAGEFVIILGHNGSGKSSLVKILSGDKRPTSGMILINQKKLSEMSNKAKAQNIVTITQNPHDRLFCELTLKENIILWEDRYDVSALETNLPPPLLPSSLPSDLSGGEKQIFLLSLALNHPPNILFLDEHTSALDPKASDNIMEFTNSLIRLHKITTIMVTHKLEDATKYGDRLIIMKEGIIVKDILKTPELSINEIKTMM